MIAIGARYGGPELRESALCRAIMKIAGCLKEQRGPISDEDIRLNPIFHVPGSVSGPIPFQGSRYSKFSSSPLCLAVEVSLPQSAVNSPNPIDPLLLELRGCNAMAFEFYRQRVLSFLSQRRKLYFPRLGRPAMNPRPNPSVKGTGLRPAPYVER